MEPSGSVHDAPPAGGKSTPPSRPPSTSKTSLLFLALWNRPLFAVRLASAAFHELILNLHTSNSSPSLFATDLSGRYCARRKTIQQLPLPLLSSSISFSDAHSTTLELFTKWMLSNSKTKATKPFSQETTLALSTFILRLSKRTTRSLLSSPTEPRCEVIHRTCDR